MRTIVFSVALFLVGCGTTPPPPMFKGVVWLSWTIQGQPASDAACAGIDHLAITVESTPSVGVRIEPVACVKGGGWERADVPEGSDTVIVDAVDASGRPLLANFAMVGVTEAQPPTATTIDLQPR